MFYSFHTVIWKSEGQPGFRSGWVTPGSEFVACSRFSPANPEVTRSDLQASVYMTCFQQTTTTVLTLQNSPPRLLWGPKPRSYKLLQLKQCYDWEKYGQTLAENDTSGSVFTGGLEKDETDAELYMKAWLQKAEEFKLFTDDDTHTHASSHTHAHSPKNATLRHSYRNTPNF